jgi:hypothetical protein
MDAGKSAKLASTPSNGNSTAAAQVAASASGAAAVDNSRTLRGAAVDTEAAGVLMTGQVGAGRTKGQMRIIIICAEKPCPVS